MAHISEDRLADIIVLVEAFGPSHAAADQRCPFIDTAFDQALYLVVLDLADDGASTVSALLGSPILWVAAARFAISSASP